MAYVYILKSLKNGKYYIGSTKDIERRVKKHKAGGVSFTKGILPIELIFHQEFDSIETAKRIERRLKGLKRRDYIEKIGADGYLRLSDG